MRFYMTVGISGSGKSTWATEMEKYEYIHLSSDQIRKEMWGSESDQREPAKVFQEMERRTIEALKDCRDVIYDATNLNARRRRALVSMLRHRFKDIECYAKVFYVPIHECMRHDEMRSRTVGREVIQKQLRQFQIPTMEEGWTGIKNTFLGEYDKESLISLMEGYNQYNHHHSYDLLTHCEKAGEFFQTGSLLHSTAILHDIGKLFTRIFDDRMEAHYPGHANAGAYISMMVNDLEYEERVRRALLIQHHMDLFGDEAAFEKLGDRYGDDFFEAITSLHEADVGAHEQV